MSKFRGSQIDIAREFFRGIYNEGEGGSALHFKRHILYSYNEPIAIRLGGANHHQGYLISSDKWSKTTSMHQGCAREFAPANTAIVSFRDFARMYRDIWFAVIDGGNHQYTAQQIENMIKIREAVEYGHIRRS